MKQVRLPSRNLAVLVVATSIDSLASGLFSPIWGVFLRSRGLPLSQVGAICAVGALLPVVTSPALGRLSDRWGRKRMLLLANVAAALLFPVLFLTRSAWLIGALQMANMVLERSAVPLESALLADCTRQDRRATAFAVYETFNTASYVIGLFLGGALLAGMRLRDVLLLPRIDVERLLMCSAMLYLAAPLVRLLLRDSASPRVRPDSAPPGATAAPARQRWRRLLGDVAAIPSMPPLLAYQVCFSALVSAMPIFFPLLAAELGAPASWLGPIVAASWLTYATVQPLSGFLSDRYGLRSQLIRWGWNSTVALMVVMACAALGDALLPPRWGLAIVVLGWVLLGVPDGLSRPGVQSLTAEVVPARRRGEFYGILGAASSFGAAVGPVLYGSSAQASRVATVFALACMFAVGSLAAVRWLLAASPTDEADRTCSPASEAIEPASRPPGS